MTKAILFCQFFFVFTSFIHLGAFSEDIYLKRLNAYFLVGDHEGACLEAAQACRDFPQSKVVFEAYIKSLARAGEEKMCLEAWNDYAVRYPADDAVHQLIIEEMAWATIKNAATSHSPPLRLLGLLAAFLSQDAKGISLIKQGLRDSNILIKTVAVKLCGNLRDAVLQDEIEKIVKSEKVWKVRQEAIKTAGSMNLKNVRDTLLAIASDTSVHAQARAAAISSLVQMQKTISRQELISLIQSDRAGMRVLACEVVQHLELQTDLHLLMPLLNDYSADVRSQALYTLGMLRQPIDLQKGKVVQLLEDRDTTVAITAAWVVTMNCPNQGQESFSKFLSHEDPKVRRLAASALVATGIYGFPLIESVFRETADPYLRLNLALGLIGQRRITEEASQAIYDSLTELSEQIMETTDGKFKYIAPSSIKHDELTPNYPEAVNQKTRLELLNILAVLNHPKAIEAIKLFLQQKKWGISGLASAVLLTEGDDAALDLVTQLLHDPDPTLRLQAAFVLALWGGIEEALVVLETAYPSATYEEKEKIIEGVGRVGSKKSLNFLIQRLAEPHQSLRLIAAAGLLKILYN